VSAVHPSLERAHQLLGELETADIDFAVDQARRLDESQLPQHDAPAGTDPAAWHAARRHKQEAASVSAAEKQAAWIDAPIKSALAEHKENLRVAMAQLIVALRREWRSETAALREEIGALRADLEILRAHTVKADQIGGSKLSIITKEGARDVA
jgi:hypothetical protein